MRYYSSLLLGIILISNALSFSMEPPLTRNQKNRAKKAARKAILKLNANTRQSIKNMPSATHETEIFSNQVNEPSSILTAEQPVNFNQNNPSQEVITPYVSEVSAQNENRLEASSSSSTTLPASVQIPAAQNTQAPVISVSSLTINPVNEPSYTITQEQPVNPYQIHHSEKIITPYASDEDTPKTTPSSSTISSVPVEKPAEPKSETGIISVTSSPAQNKQPYIAGLGIFITGWDLWNQPGNVLWEVETKKFDTNHPSNQGRVASTVRKMINKDQIEYIAKLLAALQSLDYPIENSPIMKELYKYLLSKQEQYEKGTRQEILTLLQKTSTDITSEINSLGKAFFEQVKNIQGKLDIYKKRLEDAVATKKEKVNMCKQARSNCIKSNKESINALPGNGYNSDTDEKAAKQYTEQMLLDRIALYPLMDEVQNNMSKIRATLDREKSNLSQITVFKVEDKS